MDDSVFMAELSWPEFHSEIQRSPLLSAQTRRAPWFGVGGSMICAEPVARSIFAKWLPASDT